MTDPFGAMVGALFRSPLAVEIEYLQHGFDPVIVKALEGQPDVEGSIGPVTTGHDVRVLEVPTEELGQRLGLAYLWEPRRKDQWYLDGETFQVDQDPHKDLMRLTWFITGYRVID